jgi:hypothetical protein
MQLVASNQHKKKIGRTEDFYISIFGYGEINILLQDYTTEQLANHRNTVFTFEERYNILWKQF